MVSIGDARVVARFSDGLILVVRSGSTSRDAAQLAITRFADDGIPVIGTVLNFWNPKASGHSHYSGYYYAGYYHYYGDGSGNGNAGGDGDSDGDGGAKPSPKGGKVRDRDVQSPTEQLVVSPVSMRAARSAAMERWLQENAKT